MNQVTLNRTVTVVNPEGLHARPADLLVRLASQFESQVLIAKDGTAVDCKSILSLLTLGAAQGTELELTVSGRDAAQALASIGQFIESGFEDSPGVPAAASPLDADAADSTPAP